MDVEILNKLNESEKEINNIYKEKLNDEKNNKESVNNNSEKYTTENNKDKKLLGSKNIMGIYKSISTNLMYKVEAYNNRNKKIKSLLNDSLKGLKELNEEKIRKSFKNIQIQCNMDKVFEESITNDK